MAFLIKAKTVAEWMKNSLRRGLPVIIVAPSGKIY